MTIESTTPRPATRKSLKHAAISDKSHRLGDEIYDALLAQLMSLRIAPGARMTVDALSRELGVSQTPIREALGRLESEGLVVKTHLIGYRAAPQLSKQQFAELYELRLLIEPFLAGRAAQFMDDDALASLADFAQRMSTLQHRDDRVVYSQFARADAEFHDRIARAARNELLRDTLARQHTHIHLFRLGFHSQATAQALAEHDAIVGAITKRNPEAAATAMHKHIERSRQRFTSMFENRND